MTERADDGHRGTVALRASGLRRRFGHADATSVEVLRGLDLAVRAGELVTVAGRSGSGKSSLLAVLCGFDSPDDGTVSLGDEIVAGDPSWHTCAVLPQALGLAGELTIAENVALPLRLRAAPVGPAAIYDTVSTLLEQLDIAALANRYPGEVSFGQQQRVALARAVAGAPRVLLADEPTAHLDAASTPLVLTLLRRCADEGAAVVVATHDPEVHRVADRRMDLVDGALVDV